MKVARAKHTKESTHPVDQALPPGQMVVYGLQHVMSM